MILTMVAIYDNKTAVWISPWFTRSKVEAQRTFSAVLQDEKSMMSKFPEDYDLFLMGEFDDLAGRFLMKDKPELLGTGFQVAGSS